MKKKIVLLIAICSILVYSCTKNQEVNAANGKARTLKTAAYTGEDDDFPIIIKPKKPSGFGISGCSVVIYNSGDTLKGITDSSGTCIIGLPYLGSWNIGLYANGFLPFNGSIAVVDSNMIIVDTLQVQ